MRCRPAACCRGVYPRAGSGAGPVGRLDSSQAGSSLRRRPSSGVGRAINGAVAVVKAAAAAGTGSASRRAARDRDQLAHGGRDFLGETADVIGRGHRHDVRAHPAGQRQFGELLRPVTRSAVREAVAAAERAADVQQPPDLLRPPAGCGRRVVDRGVARRELVELDVGGARQPAVRLGAREREHPRLVCTEPDLDVVHRRRPGTRPVDRVMGPVVLDRARLGGPRGTDHVDRLGERIDRLAGREQRPAVGGDRLPEGAGAEAELDAAAAEDVQARDAARQHDRRAQRQVGDVRRDAHVDRLGGDDRQHRPGVEEPRLVRVILKRHEIQPHGVGQASELQHRRRLAGKRRDEDTELQVVPVVGHRRLLEA